MHYITEDAVIMSLIVRDMKGTRHYFENFSSNYTMYRFNTLLTKMTVYTENQM